MNDKEEAVFRLEAVKQIVNLSDINSRLPGAKPIKVDEMLKDSHTVYRYIKLGATQTDSYK